MYRNLIARYSVAILCLFLLASAAAAYFLPGLGIEASLDLLLNEDDSDLAYYNITRPDWSYDEYVMVCVQKDEWFSQEALGLLAEFNQQLEKVPHVQKGGVVSILKVPLLRNQPPVLGLPMPLSLAFVPIWVVAAIVIQMFPESPWRIVGILAIGLVIAAMDGAMHEAAHGHLVQGRSGNWIAGFFFGAPGLLSITAYRVYHHRHHRQALAESSAITEGLLNGTPLYLFAIPYIGWRHGRGRDRVQIVIEYLLIGSGLIGIATLVTRDRAFSSVRDMWLLPLAISIVITCFRGWSEGIAKWLLSRSTNPPRFTPLGLLYWGTCDHLIHHLWPGSPWYKRGPLNENMWREHQSLEPSGLYLRFLWNRFEKAHSEPPAGDEVPARP